MDRVDGTCFLAAYFSIIVAIYFRYFKWLIWILFFGLFAVFYIYGPSELKKFPTGIFGELEDSIPFLWSFDLVLKNIISYPNRLFDGGILYPASQSLLFQDIMFLGTFIYHGFHSVVDNKIFAFNLTVLSFLIANTVCMYYFCRHFLRSIPAVASSLIFGFSLIRLCHLERMHLLPQFFFPLAALFILKYETNKKISDLVLVSMCVVLQFYQSTTLGLILGVMLIPYIVFNWVRCLQKKVPLLHSAIFLMLIGLLVSPLALSYFKVSKEHGFYRSKSDARMFSAHVFNYVMVPEQHPYAPFLGMQRQSWKIPYLNFRHEKHLFVGFAVLVLALVGFFKLNRAVNLQPCHCKMLLFTTILFTIWMSLGPRGGIYWLLYEVFPPLRSLRTPVRFSLGYLFLVSILSGIGLSTLLSSVRSTALKGFLCGFLLLIFLFENRRMFPHEPVSEDLASVSAYLTHLPGDKAPVLHLPLSQYKDSSRMYYKLIHGHPIVNGNCGFVPEFSLRLPGWVSRMETDDDPFLLLKQAGIRYIVVEKQGVGAPILHRFRRVFMTPMYEDAFSALYDLNQFKLRLTSHSRL